MQGLGPTPHGRNVELEKHEGNGEERESRTWAQIFPFAPNGSPPGFRALLECRKHKTPPPPAIGNMVFSDAGMIFMEGYIQTIMEAFSMPLLSPGMRK